MGQRLHAYAHIKKLLKRGNKAEREGMDDDDSRALQLALANNFVTSLTSLVVTTAQNDTTLASVGDELVQDTPFRRNYGYYGGLQSYSGKKGGRSRVSGRGGALFSNHAGVGIPMRNDRGGGVVAGCCVKESMVSGGQ